MKPRATERQALTIYACLVRIVGKERAREGYNAALTMTMGQAGL
jgi:hypothetical protein